MGNPQLSELFRRVRDQGVLTVKMEEFTEAMDVGRLGSRIREKIQRELSSEGIGFIPPLDEYPLYELPHNQSESVRLYWPDSEAGKLINAVLHPAESTDETIRDEAGAVSNAFQEAQLHSTKVLDALDRVYEGLDEVAEEASSMDTVLSN